MEIEIIKVVKGFEFNRDVETKFGVLPMVATVTFTEVTEEEKAEIAKDGIEFNTLMEVRTVIYGHGNVSNTHVGFENIDMNDEKALLTYATDFLNNRQKELVERVAVDLYVKADSEFWSMFDDESMPDMSEYRTEKQRYHDEVSDKLKSSRF